MARNLDKDPAMWKRLHAIMERIKETGTETSLSHLLVQFTTEYPVTIMMMKRRLDLYKEMGWIKVYDDTIQGVQEKGGEDVSEEEIRG